MKKTLITICLALVFILSSSQAQASPGENKKVFFIHHSTGAIYWDGENGQGMEYYLTEHGYEANDVDYWDGETDVDDWYDLFSQDSTWDIIGDADIVLFKSCFPNSAIRTGQLPEYKEYYRELYEIYEAHPDVLFVPFSTPPLPRDMTTYKQAQRAKKFDKWLTHAYVDDYEGNNLAPFRLHRLLRNKRGYLHKDYVVDSQDGHPTDSSGNVVGQRIWQRLDNVLESL